MTFLNASYPNYYNESPDLVCSDKDSIDTLDIFDKALQNNVIFKNDMQSDSPPVGSSTPRNIRSRLSKISYKTVSLVHSHDLNELYYVHYVTDLTTLQGVSIQYDCPVGIIRKTNRFNSIQSFDDVRIRKLLLIPLRSCGDKLHHEKIYDPPHHDKTLLNLDAVDVEAFMNDSFAHSEDSSHSDAHNCTREDLCGLSGTALSRAIRRDIQKEYKIKDCLESLMLKGFLFIHNDRISFLFKIPDNLLNKKKRSISPSEPNEPLFDKQANSSQIGQQKPNAGDTYYPWVHRVLRALGYSACSQDFVQNEIELDNIKQC